MILYQRSKIIQKYNELLTESAYEILTNKLNAAAEQEIIQKVILQQTAERKKKKARLKKFWQSTLPPDKVGRTVARGTAGFTQFSESEEVQEVKENKLVLK